MKGEDFALIFYVVFVLYGLMDFHNKNGKEGSNRGPTRSPTSIEGEKKEICGRIICRQNNRFGLFRLIWKFKKNVASTQVPCELNEDA